MIIIAKNCVSALLVLARPAGCLTAPLGCHPLAEQPEHSTKTQLTPLLTKARFPVASEPSNKLEKLQTSLCVITKKNNPKNSCEQLCACVPHTLSSDHRSHRGGGGGCFVEQALERCWHPEARTMLLGSEGPFMSFCFPQKRNGMVTGVRLGLK